MKKIGIVIILLLVVSFVSAQSIQTASEYFQSVSDWYASIQDYEADMSIVAGDQRMQASVSFKKPNLLRIDFSNPDTQVITFNGELLTVYLPGSDAILLQSVSTGEDTSASSGMNLNTPQGLSLMSRYYYIAYESGQTPVLLSDDSDEKVMKLVLTRKNSSEGFKTITLSIVPSTKLIRRVEAVTAQDVTFMFTFTGYNVNVDIPDARFIYDAPSSANNYNNFLFTE